MKKYILVFLLGLSFFPVLSDIITGYNYTNRNKVSKKLWLIFSVPGYGLHKGIAGMCTNEQSSNGHGWKFIKRDYFECGKLNIYISDKLYGKK